GDEGDAVAESLVVALKPRHLLTARYTPGRPELEVNGLVTVELRQVDRLSIDRLERDVGAGKAEERSPRRLGTTLSRLVTLRASVGRLVLHDHDQEPRGLRRARVLRDDMKVIRALVEGPAGTERYGGGGPHLHSPQSFPNIEKNQSVVAGGGGVSPPPPLPPLPRCRLFRPAPERRP